MYAENFITGKPGSSEKVQRDSRRIALTNCEGPMSVREFLEREN